MTGVGSLFLAAVEPLSVQRALRVLSIRHGQPVDQRLSERLQEVACILSIGMLGLQKNRATFIVSHSLCREEIELPADIVHFVGLQVIDVD